MEPLENRAVVNLSIKNVPAEQVELLKARAKRNHRSLQGELRAILDAAAGRPERKLSIQELSDYIATLGLTRANEAAKTIREDRDR